MGDETFGPSPEEKGFESAERSEARMGTGARPSEQPESQPPDKEKAGELLRQLETLVEDPRRFHHFRSLPDIREVIDKVPERRDSVFQEFEDKYKEFPGEEEEERQVREYLGEGHSSRWQTETAERYKQLFPDRPFYENKWKQTALLVRDELRLSRLEEYKERARAAGDEEKVMDFVYRQVPLKRAVDSFLETTRGGNEEETGRYLVEEVSEQEGREILQRAEIHGDPYKGKRLTKEILEKEGLLPKYKVKVGESSVWLSSLPYNARSGRLAVVAFVEANERIFARTYYRSNSQGIWRYLPEYKTEEGEISWYGKGYSEESITLPISIQKALAEISKEGMPVLNVENPDLIFAGTAKEIKGDTKAGHYYQEVHDRPQFLDGKFYTGDIEKKVTPEQLQFNDPRESPDFTKPLTSWDQNTSLYGNIKIEVFPSKDGRFAYMFCRDNKGRVWVGGIETSGRVCSTGLRRSWVYGGDLATPAYEYDMRTCGFGNYNDRQGRYVDMWENYLSKIPVIQEYLQFRK